MGESYKPCYASCTQTLGNLACQGNRLLSENNTVNMEYILPTHVEDFLFRITAPDCLLPN